MERKYNYKRIGARKLSLIIFVCTLLIAVIFYSSTVLPVLMVAFASILLYSTYKKSYVVVKEEQFEIVGKKIPVNKIKEISIGEKRIDVIVEKGTFLLGTHLYMTDTCFDSSNDWNDFKKDMEILKKDNCK